MDCGARREGGEGIWGDGFAEDSLIQIVAVRSWDQCENEELIRVFPKLLRHTAGLPGPVRSLLARCAEALDRKPHAPPKPHGVSWLRGSGKQARDDSRVSIHDERRHAALRTIRDVLQAFERGQAPAFDESIACEIAFWAGVHPAYIWPEALLSHDLFTALGWLGHAERKGRAVLPLDVAEFFLDALELSGGDVRVADARVAAYVTNSALLASLLTACQRRRLGIEQVFSPGFADRVHQEMYLSLDRKARWSSQGMGENAG